MVTTLVRRGVHRRALALAIAIVSAIVLAASFHAADAQAYCGSGGSSPNQPSCLPGSGYTYDTTWNCGVTAPDQDCYQPGRFLYENGEIHTWGWGSADYDGAGAVTVTVCAGGAGSCSWYANGYNHARACALNNCNDTTANSKMSVHPFSGSGNHTVYGHGKA